ncbi:UDP-N-acetylmuramoyl-tripeptide--D-alanyl-D-alanine ligase [Patescibacteria group bacterium]|nr:UDP-N-acetylmuramoyl-tripeptide--D-alanyl-D-alanine ligase [Patescibacteria group bacterium]
MLATGLIVVDLLFWTYLAQLKEYRVDRLKEYFSSTEGRELIKKRLFLIFFFFIFLAIVLIISYLSQNKSIPAEIAASPVLLFAFYVFAQTYSIMQKIRKKQLRLPGITSRAILTLAIAILLMLIIVIFSYSFLLHYMDVTLLMFQTWSPIFVFTAVLAIHPMSVFLKKRIFKKATEKRDKCKNLIVIGVTGSYGKTSVKEFLYGILKDQFNTLKTEEHVNTEVGVARTVLEKLTSDHEIFIVEMGAYKKGEIKKICSIVKPTIGIITAINEQHIALFKSMKNIVSAKAELAFAVPKKGQVILNKDNKYCRLIGSKIKKKTSYYSMKTRADLTLKKSDIGAKGTTFSVIYKGAIHQFSTKLIGEHTVQNLLAAIVTALKLGVPYQNIQKSVSQLRPVHENMEVITAKNRVYIDNTYNLNPESIVAAKKLMNQAYPQYKKVVVLDDVLELGNKSSAIHGNIGKTLSKGVDDVYLIGKNYAVIVKKSMLRAGKSASRVHIGKQTTIVGDIRKMKGNVAVAFLGRGAKKIFKGLHD